MGRYTFIIVFLGLITVIAAVVPSENEFNGALQVVPSDSTELMKHEIYICRGHYFEWCSEPSNCAYDNEALEKVNLWEYYKLLECEECQQFFNDNYPKFVGEEIKL